MSRTLAAERELSREDASDEELIELIAVAPENDPNAAAALEILERRLVARGVWEDAEVMQ